MPFDGAKIALLAAGRVAVLRRDDRDDIPWPGYWDLPGGGREGDETPLDCALHETAEELNLAVDAGNVFWAKSFATGTVRRWFFAAWLDPDAVGGIRLGDEGTAWRMMPLGMFVQHPNAVPALRERLQACLRESGIPTKNPPHFGGGR